MPGSRRARFCLYLVVLSSLVLLGSNIEKQLTVAGTSPITVTTAAGVATVACPTCFPGTGSAALDFTVKGGLIGGGGGLSGSFSIFDSGTTSTTGRIPFAVTSIVNGGPVICFGTGVDPLSKNVIDAVFNKRSADGIDVVPNLAHSTFNPAAVAGCYGQTLYPFLVQRFEELEVAYSDLLAMPSDTTWAGELRGTTSQPLADYYATGTVTASSTVYSGAGQGRTLAAVLTVEGTAANVIPYAGTAQNFCVRTGSSQPAGGALVITLRKNGAATAIVVTVAASSGNGLYCDTDTVAFVATDWYTWELANANIAASAQVNNITMEFVPSSTPKAMFFFPKANNALTASVNNYFYPYMAATRSATETDKWAAIARAGTLVSLYCYVETAPANTITVTVQQNGVASAATGTITAAGGTGVKTIWTGSLAVSANTAHTINYATGAGAQAVIPQCAMEFD